MESALIVVPCYNEAKRLAVHEFLAFAARQANVRFLMVNDGSADATGDLLRSLSAARPHQFEQLDMAANSGKAEAVRQGLLHALDRQASNVGFWDADLATPLDAIPQFLAVLERRPEINVVVGARLPLLGRHIERRPVRRVLGRAFATAASWALGLRIYDTQCGAKLFRAVPEVVLAFQERFLARWIFDVEILARLTNLRRAAGGSAIAQTIYELPLDEWREIAGSKLKSGDFFRAAGELAAIYSRYLGPRAATYAPPPPVRVESTSPPLTRRAA